MALGGIDRGLDLQDFTPTWQLRVDSTHETIRAHSFGEHIKSSSLYEAVIVLSHGCNALALESRRWRLEYVSLRAARECRAVDNDQGLIG